MENGKVKEDLDEKDEKVAGLEGNSKIDLLFVPVMPIFFAIEKHSFILATSV